MDNTHRGVEDKIATIADLQELLDTIQNEFSHPNKESVEKIYIRHVHKKNKEIQDLGKELL